MNLSRPHLLRVLGDLQTRLDQAQLFALGQGQTQRNEPTAVLKPRAVLAALHTASANTNTRQQHKVNDNDEGTEQEAALTSVGRELALGSVRSYV